MSESGANQKANLGFLSVVEHPEHGLFGGYLVLNTAARPLEFHCTAPIKPNRAQEILYGPTLEAFLYGDQIGQALLAKAKSKPLFVCTDRPPVLAVRRYVSFPVALIVGSEGNASEDTAIEAVDHGGKHLRLDAAHSAGPRLLTFALGANRLAVPEQSEQDRQLITEHHDRLSESFDFAEPFTRIREAIEEAQRAVR